ncbi:hypothetical protein EON62_05195 [archaeon]|nr:MAG: hypothetical protein EON62_05195 [archaeon]
MEERLEEGERLEAASLPDELDEAAGLPLMEDGLPLDKWMAATSASTSLSVTTGTPDVVAAEPEAAPAPRASAAPAPLPLLAPAPRRPVGVCGGAPLPPPPLWRRARWRQ